VAENRVRDAEVFESARWSGNVAEGTLTGSETILLVEDEAFVRDVTREVLLAAGYTVLTSRTAAEALSIFAGHHREVDLLVTDIVLPGETGRTLARGLRLHNPDLAVLFITGYAEQMNVGEAERADSLAKPFSTGVLLRRIKELLDRRQAWRRDVGLLKRASGSA
jgi:two-component system, cell cycle sensor histidine kinase and response regulator CckA